MSGADNTPEMQAGLRPNPRHDPVRVAINVFNNRLNELIFALDLNDEPLARHAAGELERMYREAIKA